MGVVGAPLRRAPATEQLLQREVWNGAAQDDRTVMHLDIETLAVAEPDGAHDLTRESNGQVSSPFAYSDVRHGNFHR